MNMILNTADPNTIRFGEEGGYQSIGDVFKNGGTVFILGILTIFCALAIVWGVLELFHYCSSTLPKKRNQKKNPVAAFTPAPVVLPQTEITATQDDDEEIVAVIAAAISAATSEIPNGKFKVVSFRRK